MIEEKEEKVQKSRRGLQKYKENPFLEAAATATKTRSRKITNTNGDRMMMVAENTGEIVAPVAGFWHTEEVDKTQFVKLYINGVKAFKELTPSGTKVFELLYLGLQQNIGKDQIHLSFLGIDQTVTPISEAVYYRGMKELISKNFMAESMMTNIYYVNPDFVWNGDRLAFVKDYRLKRTKEVKKIIEDTKTMQLPFDE